MKKTRKGTPASGKRKKVVKDSLETPLSLSYYTVNLGS
jgi:hypothetical protein